MHFMKMTPWYIAAIAPLAAASFAGAFVGQFAVLAVTLGLLFSTVNLTRVALPSADPPRSESSVVTRLPGA